MVTKNIKAYIKKYLPVMGVVLLMLAAVTSYSANRTTVSTFINHQSKAVLADDIFNTCQTSCPTERQTPYTAHVQGQHILSTPYGLAPPSLLIIVLLLLLFVTKTLLPHALQLFFATASKQSLYSIWRI